MTFPHWEPRPHRNLPSCQNHWCWRHHLKQKKSPYASPCAEFCGSIGNPLKGDHLWKAVANLDPKFTTKSTPKSRGDHYCFSKSQSKFNRATFLCLNKTGTSNEIHMISPRLCHRLRHRCQLNGCHRTIAGQVGKVRLNGALVWSFGHKAFPIDVLWNMCYWTLLRILELYGIMKYWWFKVSIEFPSMVMRHDLTLYNDESSRISKPRLQPPDHSNCASRAMVATIRWGQMERLSCCLWQWKIGMGRIQRWKPWSSSDWSIKNGVCTPELGIPSVVFKHCSESCPLSRTSTYHQCYRVPL